MNNQKLVETVAQMHKIMGQDDTLDMGALELWHFYNKACEVFKAGTRDNIINALYDCYLFGVYRGQHGADQEG